ncbi:ArnT family glycosyltransferase [Halothiobacillus sp. DCM-1]|uniref:ArnT family glycosyltransferase n=1 Tax=Halothiobacillus sp. DCM-1 TaxID=3112558 RepID=UPI00324781A6
MPSLQPHNAFTRTGHWLLNRPWLILALYALWVGCTLNLRALFVPDEGRYVSVALGMLHSGDWLVPRLDGLPFFHKPPLFYWITAGSLGVFGVHEWAARLAPFLASLSVAGTLFWFLNHHASRRAAALAVLLLATFPLFFDASQFASMDTLVGSLIAITVLLLAHASERLAAGQRAGWVLVLAYATAGLGMMTKGMIGFVLPGMAITFWILWQRRYRQLYQLISIPGLIVFAALVLPWFLLMERQFPGFLHYTFIYQQFDRYLDSTFNNPQPIYYYVLVLFGGLLPWSVLAIGGHFFKRPREYLYANTPASLRNLGLIWLLSILVFFSIPTSKLIGYILPTVPALTLLGALWLDAALTHSPAPNRWIRALWLGSVIGASLSMTSVFIFHHIDKKSHKALTEQVRPQISAAARVVFYNYYFFSVPFYLNRATPVQVTGEWHDPALFKTDGANTELYTSAKFDPARASSILISTHKLAEEAQAADQGTAAPVWVFIHKDEAAKLPLLSGKTPIASDQRTAVYCFGCASRETN